MKHLSTLLPCAALLQHVAAQGAYLYTVDRHAHSNGASADGSGTNIIDSQTASAIIARRRELTSDRYLGITDELLLEDINNFGGYQAPLFGERQEDAPGKLFIRISGVDLHINDFDGAMPDLWIQDPAKDLLSDFKARTDRLEKDRLCEYAVPPNPNNPDTKGVEVVFTYPVEQIGCLGASSIPNIPVILPLYHYLPTNPAGVKTQITALIKVLKHLAATDDVESTVLLLPSKLQKPKHHHKHAARDAQKSEEEPLDLPLATAGPASTFDDITSVAASNASSNFTLPSVIPVCFTSQSACENTTNFCSGHGNCHKAHTNCFKCKCGTTLARINPDGTKKTVQWGGNACQKKDVSIPFILFASFGVFMVTLVAGGIGMLYSMGSQELPSVIGAGVAGPSRGK